MISDRLYEALAENMQVWIMHLSRDATVEIFNRFALDLLGYTREEVIGRNFFDVVRFDTPAEEVWGLFQHLLSGGRVIGREGVVRRKDGSPVVIIWSAVPTYAPDGEIIGVAGMAVDITARKKAETALKESELRYRTLAETADLAIVHLLPDGTLAYCNRYFEELTGYSRDEVVGCNYMRLFAPGRSIKSFEAQMAKVLAGEVWMNYERAIRTKDGSVRLMLWSAARTLDAEGRPNGAVGTGVDITDRKRVEEEVRKLNEELEQRVRARTAQLESANKDLEAFTYSVSHDLRAPLRHVDGFSRMLEETLGPDLPEDARRYLDVIRYSTGQMAKLIDDLLALSRVGRKSLNMQNVSMDELVDDVLMSLSDELEGRDLKMIRQPLPQAWGDPGLLRQVWSNLISNAVKFTRKTENAEVEIGSRVEDDQRVYYVKDNGVGFDMKYAGKIFGVFQRLHRPEEFEGTGVGLAIVQRIIRRHGGRVWAEASPGLGATLYFVIGGGPE